MGRRTSNTEYALHQSANPANINLWVRLLNCTAVGDIRQPGQVRSASAVDKCAGLNRLHASSICQAHIAEARLDKGWPVFVCR